MTRPSIVVHNANLTSIIEQKPVPMTVYLDQIVTAGPNNSKHAGSTVIKCDTADAMVTEDLDTVNSLIGAADVEGNFMPVTSAVLKNKAGELQKILVRKKAIAAEFVSPTADYTVLNTIVGPMQVLKP